MVVPDKERRGLQPFRRVRHLERDFRRVRVCVPAGVGIDVVKNCRDILPLLKAFFLIPENGVGGNLHIFLEEGNVDDGSLRFCFERAREAGDELGTKIAEMALECSKTQRRKICGMWRESLR